MTGAPRVTPSPSRVPSYPPPTLHVFRTPQLRNNLPNVRAPGSARKAPLFPSSTHFSPWGRAECTQRAKNFPVGESIFLPLLLRRKETGSYLDILSSFSETLEEFSTAVHTNIPPNGHLLICPSLGHQRRMLGLIKHHLTFPTLAVPDPREEKSFPGLAVTSLKATKVQRKVTLTSQGPL